MVYILIIIDYKINTLYSCNIQNMYKLAIIVTIFSLLLIGGCYYDVEEELYPTTECDTNDVTYSGTVLGIIEASCFQCHDKANNFGGVTLEDYTNLKIYVDNGQLIGSIRHEAGFSAMPQGQAQLPECDIQKIEAWIADGAPEN